MNEKYTDSDEDLRRAVAENTSISGVLRSLNRCVSGGSHSVIRKRIAALGLDHSHFVGRASNRGIVGKAVNKRPLSTILVVGKLECTRDLKARLFKEGLKQKRCEKCDGVEWLGKPIPLALHHVNGNRLDNRLENLQILCYNCHGFTENYCGKNIIKRRLG